MKNGIERMAALQTRREKLIQMITKLETEIQEIREELFTENPFSTDREYREYLSARGENG
jgi:predicted ATP-grasp superfamily ATP-dependent carboligase